MREIKYWIKGQAVSGTSGRPLPVREVAAGASADPLLAAIKERIGRIAIRPAGDLGFPEVR